MENIIANNKQELINALCLAYAEFLNFDLHKLTFNDVVYDTISRNAGRISNFIYNLNSNASSGKILALCYKNDVVSTSEVISAEEYTEKTKHDSYTQHKIDTFRRVLHGKSDYPDYMCFRIDFEKNTAERIFAEQAEKFACKLP